MKKLTAWIAICLSTALLSGCGKPIILPDSTEPTMDTNATTEQVTTAPETKPIETTVATEPEPTSIPTEPTTELEHSELYIPDLSVEDVIRYFNEVCLDAEFVNDGDPSVLQKWTVPIYYILHGEYTSEDLQTLSSFADWLNTSDGFPGIYETQDPTQANLRIHFCLKEDIPIYMGEDYVDLDGAVTFWYSDNEIYDAIICYSTDINQYVRNSVILEEIYNGLGPVQDTSLRSDSIIYSEFSDPQSLTEIDELLLKLLYHPRMQCGMDSVVCETVIRKLYY